jgi:type II secretory pathway pseudopilin PulG
MLSAQRRESESSRPTVAGSRAQEGGYILLTLLLVVALMAILAIGIIIPISFSMQRDQEQEMIHRGVQYSRAIRAYYKKFGRYPTKLEDLDNTNNLRYLRKHYKDPLTRQDFKLLHFGEPGVTLGGGLSIGGGSIPGANPVGSPTGMNGSGSSSSGFGSSGFGGSGFGGSGFGNSGSGNSGFGSSGVNSSGVFSQSSGLGGNSSSGFGANSNSQTTAGQAGTNPAAGSDPSQAGSPAASQTGSTGQGEASSGGQQLVAGGPIVGVASLSKKTTIREFNKKKKYNEWQFVYDPTTDRGGLITTPYQPALQGFGSQPGMNGAQPAGGNGSAFGNSSGSGFGNSNGSSFGQGSGFGNNNPNPGGTATPTPPANPPQQQ